MQGVGSNNIDSVNIFTTLNSTEFLRNIAFEGKKIAKKAFGQNFLVSEEIIKKITASFDCTAETNIIEIGTGLGSLTFFLIQKTQKFTGIEKDAELNQRMIHTFPHCKFINKDALKVDFTQIISSKTTIVSNLPYNVGTKILTHIGTTCLQDITSIVVMLQKDVIEKIITKHGSKGYHQLGAFFQTFCKIEEICIVPPSSFSPAPNVLSAVVKISPITKINNIQGYWAFLHKAFSYNRKMLSTIFDGKICNEFAKKRPAELTPNELLQAWIILQSEPQSF